MIAILSLWLLTSLKPSRRKPYWHNIPAGTVRIAENLYYDDLEVGNLEWRAYMYWSKTVFGENSEEYRASLPDTTVWTKIDTASSWKNYVEWYLRHPAYDFYPLVGVSQQQAEHYTKWRADRVFEKILIDNGVIEWYHPQSREDYFSIERYFAGKYHNMKPDSNFRNYPDYRLPSLLEWKQARYYEDSIEHIYRIPKHWLEPFAQDITRPIQADSVPRRGFPIYNLNASVSEWLSEKDVCAGLSWADKPELLMPKDTFQLQGPSARTGFRNVCEWKEFKMKGN